MCLSVPLEGREEFSTFKKGLWHFFDLFLLANFPKVMVESYKSNSGTQQLASCIIFFSFMIIAIHFLHNLILAIVVDAYNERTGEIQAKRERVKEESLMAAFDCLAPGEERVNDSRVTMLLHATSKLWGLRIRREALEGIPKALDTDGDGWISKEDFMNLPTLINLAIESHDDDDSDSMGVQHRTWCGPHGYVNATWNVMLTGLAKSQLFDRIIDVLLILDVILSLVKSSTYSNTEDLWETNHLLILLITVCFVAEMVCKLYVLGWRAYSNSYINLFDALTTMASLIGLVVVLAGGRHDVLELFVLFRFLRLFRLFTAFEIFRTMTKTFTTIIPSTLNLILALSLVIYFFGAYAVLAFGGEVNTSVLSKIEDTQYYRESLYIFNFNDFPTAVVVLLQVLLDSHVVVPIYDAFLLLGHAQAVGVFLFCYLVIADLILLNIVVALVLHAFFSEQHRLKGGDHGSITSSAHPSHSGDIRPYLSPNRASSRHSSTSSPQRSVSRERLLAIRESEEHKVATQAPGTEVTAIDL